MKIVRLYPTLGSTGKSINGYTGWWFQTCFCSIKYGIIHDNPNPIDELICFKMVKTTNQYIYLYMTEQSPRSISPRIYQWVDHDLSNFTLVFHFATSLAKSRCEIACSGRTSVDPDSWRLMVRGFLGWFIIGFPTVAAYYGLIWLIVDDNG